MNLKSMMKPGKGVPKSKDEFDLEDINKGLQEESSEHVWLTPAQVRRLVLDHLRIHGSDYYGEENDKEED